MDSEIKQICQQKITTVMLVPALNTRIFSQQAALIYAKSLGRHNRQVYDIGAEIESLVTARGPARRRSPAQSR